MSKRRPAPNPTRPCPHCGGTGRTLDSVAVGALLAAERERVGATKRAVAAAMAPPVSEGYVGELERGRRDWRAELIERYRAALAALR